MDTIIRENQESNYDINSGAKDFEVFYLLPKKKTGNETILRMKITEKWGGWKLKDELVSSLGLEIGNTINAVVQVLGCPGMIKDDGSMDIFASGDAAQWIIDNEIGEGSIIDAKVLFNYSRMPVSRDGKLIWNATLILVEGLNVVEKRFEATKKDEPNANISIGELKRILGD